MPMLCEPASTNTGPLPQNLAPHCIARPDVHKKGVQDVHKGTGAAVSSFNTVMLIFLFYYSNHFESLLLIQMNKNITYQLQLKALTDVRLFLCNTQQRDHPESCN